MNQKQNEHVSLVRIPHKWYYAFVWTFIIFIFLNTVAEIVWDWDWYGLLKGTALERIAILMTLIVGYFFIVAHIWDGIVVIKHKFSRKTLRSEGASNLYQKFLKAQKEGKTFKEALEKYKPETE